MQGCLHCGGVMAVLLGWLGTLCYVRCRDCGADRVLRAHEWECLNDAENSA